MEKSVKMVLMSYLQDRNRDSDIGENKRLVYSGTECGEIEEYH